MISVIVPIYKVEDYLVACVDSILASTYQDIELILVDDGSPDNCAKICDDFAARDNRVKVIHQPNMGLSGARNSGLKIATGEYIAFVDGDDVIHPRMLEVLHDAIISGDYDFSMILGVMVQDKGIGYDYVGEAGEIDVQSRRVVSQHEYMSRLADLGVDAYQYHVIWNKLYKRSIVGDHLFRKVASEDLEWSSRICVDVKQGILVEAEMYYYIQRTSSIMHADDERNVAKMDTFYTCLKNIPKELPQYRAMMLKALYSVIFGCRFENKEANAKARTIYNETKAEMLHSKLSLSRKLRLLIFYHFPALYAYLLKLRYGS